MLSLKRTVLVAVLVFSCGAPPVAPPGCANGVHQSPQKALGYSSSPLISLGRASP
jgi:hypothetical protein